MTMKERLRSRVAELTSIIGVSGHEWDVAKYIFDAIKDDVDTIEQLPNGIIVATKKGAHPGPRVMVSAHMDEVGYEVKSVSPQGYLYFDQIGGATIACLPGRRVLVKGEKGVVKGVVGIRAGHLLTPEQIAKAQTVTQSYVDICVGSREEAEALGIHAGAQIVPDSPLESIGPDGDYICTRAADCRALCAVIIETLKELKAEDIHGALKVFGFLSIPMILWFILFAREKPPTPPADEDLIERVSFADGMKQLAKNKKFIYALLVFWLLQGVYFTLTTLMEPILQFFNGGSMDSLFIGTLGTILTVTGVITTLVLPIASDRSKSKKRKPIVLVCEIGTLVGLVLIINGHTVGLQILMACCLGIFLTGVTPIVMVLGYESAYPVSEGTTESLMQLGANGWGLICLLAVNGIFQGNHMGTLVFFLAGTVLSLVLTMMIKEASLKERRIE